MPKTIAIKDMPQFTRVVTQSKWADVGAYTRDHLSDAKKREAQGITFDKDDKVTKETWGSAAQACRNAAKSLGMSVRCIFTDDTLFVEYAGPYVPKGKRENNGKATTTAKTTATKAAAAKKGARR